MRPVTMQPPSPFGPGDPVGGVYVLARSGQDLWEAIASDLCDQG